MLDFCIKLVYPIRMRNSKEYNRSYYQSRRFARADRKSPLYIFPRKPTKEEWAGMLACQGYKPIPDYGNTYWINSQGKLYFVGNRGIRLKRFDKGAERGYKRVVLGKRHHAYGKRLWLYVHRILAELFIPNPENKPYINHIDSNPSNNSLDNLEWVTPKENVHHAIKAGRFGRKPKSPCS